MRCSHYIIAACFASMLAFSVPAQARKTITAAGIRAKTSYDLPGQSLVSYLRPARRRMKRHCFGFHIGQGMAVTGAVPMEILGYALQDNSANISPSAGLVIMEIYGAGISLLGIGAGIMHFGKRHERHHPQKFLSAQ